MWIGPFFLTRFLPSLSFLLLLAAKPVLSATSITLSQALELAEKSHPQLRVSASGVDLAEAGITTARARPNPAMTAQVGHQFARIPGNVTGLVQIYGFSQPLELGSLRPTRIGVAERYRDSSRIALSGTRLAVLANVRRTFYQVLRHRNEIGILNENLRLVEELRQKIQVRVEVGEAGRLELIRAEAEVATAQTQSNSAQLRLVDSFAQFRASVGSPLDSGTTLEGELDPPAVLPPLEELEQQTMQLHPAIALAGAEIRRAESAVAYERALRLPQPSVRTDYERYPDVPNYRVGVDIPLPLWNRREGPIAEALASLRQATAAEEARRLEIMAALEGAYRRYQVATAQLSAFERGLLREAEEAVRAAQTAYQLGERGILEVLDAQRVLRTVRLDFLNAQFDREAALVDLDELRAVDLRALNPLRNRP
jgi:outer membrane protein, heavy metal efflux system